jgi:hypothetical protein
LVHFPSLEDNGPGKSATTLDGYMFRPPASGTHPALVFLHGCDGLFNRATGLIGRRERDWAAALTPRAYIVLRSTSFGPRITAKCARNGASIASLPEAASRRLRSAVVPAGTAVCGRRSSRGYRLVARWRSRVIITESGKSQRWVVYRPFFRESPPRVVAPVVESVTAGTALRSPTWSGIVRCRIRRIRSLRGHYAYMASPEISARCKRCIGPSCVTGVRCRAAVAGPAVT